MKQREGPLCPCCRRDFVVDPLDLLEEENNNGNNDNNAESNNEDTSRNEVPPIFSWDPASLDDDPDFGPIIVSARGNGAGNIVYDPARLEEGLSPPTQSEEISSSPSSNEEVDEEDAQNTNVEETLAISSPNGDARDNLANLDHTDGKNGSGDAMQA